jgi:hypothetical protein
MAYNFKTEKNTTKILKKYENVTQNVLFSILHHCFYRKYNFLTYIFLFRKQFYFVISGLKIIGHGNSDNNLASYWITF